ncbi:hypothetical protein ACFE04_025511 [Oxalis oulophora]
MDACIQSPIKPTILISPNIKLDTKSKNPFASLSRSSSLFKCRVSLQTTTEPEPVYTSVKSFAPATVANLGPGFDFLGAAVDGLGDFVSLRLDSSVNPGLLSIAEISGTGVKLTKNSMFNCAEIAAIAVMKILGIRSVGLSLSLHKASSSFFDERKRRYSCLLICQLVRVNR